MELIGIVMILVSLAGKTIYGELGINDLIVPICVIILTLIVTRR